MSNSLRLHGLQPTRLLHPWDFPGKSTGVGCHCLLRLREKVLIKHLLGESEKVRVLVALWWLTLCDPMDCSPPGSSAHGVL